jgi:DNA-binding CsgD family transcriptional regulator
MLDRLMSVMEPVVAAASAEGASRLFFKTAAAEFGATYLQTRLYRRPRGSLTPHSHLRAGGVVVREAPSSWDGSAAFNYVCLECNPLVEAIRRGLTRYRFSDFAPHNVRAFGIYWEAMGEAGIADAYCATAYASGDRIASLHLGFGTREMSPHVEPMLRMAGAMLVEKLIESDRSEGANEPGPALTGRERDSLSFVAEGKTDWEIATILGVSETTARFHVDNARRKLGAVNRAHAVARFLGASGPH